MSSIWTNHKKAIEAVQAARDNLYAAEITLEDSRKAIIEYVADKLANENDFKNRIASSPLGDDDPLSDYVKAAESRYAETLGHYKPRKPLQIEIMNPRSLDTGQPEGVGEGPYDFGEDQA